MTRSDINTPANRYGSIAAEIYDLDKPYGALPDTAFHLETLAGVTGPILEPACGSGRTLVPLLQAGHDATGFDPSEEMLAQCRARCAAAGFAPDLSIQTFADFVYDRAFAAILVPAGSFTLIGEFEEAMAVLGRFHDHLEPGGLLIVDIQSLAFLANTREDRRSWAAANGDLLTVEGKLDRIDWLRQRHHHTCRYERWRDNRLIEAQIEPMVQRQWGLEEFAFALRQTGFGDIRVNGDYSRDRPPSPRDRTLSFAARRS